MIPENIINKSVGFQPRRTSHYNIRFALVWEHVHLWLLVVEHTEAEGYWLTE